MPNNKPFCKENVSIDYISRMRHGYVYILSNKNRTTLYIGVTNSITRRVFEHKFEKRKSFTNRYNLTHLMYFEFFDTIGNAIRREKQLKNWHKAWKWNLIKETNVELVDLAKDWYEEESSLCFRRKGSPIKLD